MSQNQNNNKSQFKATDTTQKQSKKNKIDAYNILFILTDQERYFAEDALPDGYHLPGRERLKKRGVNFVNHQIASAVCSSSRSVIYTGQHIQNTKVFDNLSYPWSYDLTLDTPTIGHLLQKLDYYTAYKGKWHLTTLAGHDESALPDSELTEVIERYGFKDYVGIGDVIGMMQGGWINDDMTAAQARRWLRVNGNQMTANNQPWYLAVNLVNPHDVMFFNTDNIGEHVQDNPPPLLGTMHAPDTPLYQQQWQIKLPKSRHESFDKEGRPPAHKEYQRARDALVGAFPNEDDRWERLLNYYHNCILETDQLVETILDQLEDLKLMDSTIIVMTSDHGELGGSHGTHGKGTTAYQVQNHVPLIISHPAYENTHGQTCTALTSHLDIVPSMLAWTGNDNQDEAKKLTDDLPGYDLTPLLEKGANAAINEIREGTLYCFNMLLYLDSNFALKTQEYYNNKAKLNFNSNVKAKKYALNFDKRGAIRSVFDGRYRFTRYFAPNNFNQPQTLEEIFANNDIELFDLHKAPDELDNLALKAKQNEAIIMRLNTLLNELIDTEVNGADNGDFLPPEDKEWSVAKFDI